MIQRKKYECKNGIDAGLGCNLSIYGIESIAVSRLRYGVKNGTFAVLRDGDAITCKVEEMPKLAKMTKHEEVKQEILDLYDDLKFLKIDDDTVFAL